MSKFNIETIERLEYDFTGIDHNVQPKKGAKKFCSGKGLIPEPTEAQLEGYSVGVKRIFGLEEASDSKETKEATGDAIQKASDSVTRKLMNLTSALCQGSPSTKELEELPPRYRNAFLKWVYSEVTNPEVSGGDSPE